MDFKYALRSLQKTPGFAALAVLVIALGIGANSAVFSVVNTVLLKPLDYSDPDRIVTIRNWWKDQARASNYISAPDYHDWHDQSTAFEAMGYYMAAGNAAVIDGSSAAYQQVAGVTEDFFNVFGVRPQAGRLFNDDEQKPKSSGAVLISDSYWRSHFGGNANALGHTLRVYDKPLSIVGILPPGFGFPNKTEVWFPARALFDENMNRSSHNYFVLGRLKPGATVEQGQAQLSAISLKNEQLYPRSNKNKGVVVARMLDTMVSNVRLTLYLLLGAVGLVLLIACANVANLLLAKATSRTREIAIRAAVGASRARIVKQLVTESLVLAILAAVAGLILAVWIADALVALAPANVPRLSEIKIDKWVMMFTFVVSVVSSLLFGLAPAIHSSRVDLNDALKQGAAKNVAGGGAGRLRNGLVIAEIALSVVLLTGAGLLIRSFDALTNVDVGFKSEKVLVALVDVPAAGQEGRARAVAFDNGFVDDLRALPGVTHVGAAAAVPGSHASDGTYWIDVLPPREQLAITKDQAVFSVIGPGMFDAVGIPLKIGRDFNASDTADAPFSAIVNEALVKASFDGHDPIGRQLYCGLDSLKPMTIVGVVGDTRQFGPASKPSPEIFMPYPQHPGWATNLNMLIRTSSDPLLLSESIRRKARERRADVPVRISKLTEDVDKSVAAPRFRTLLLSVFAGLAVLLAMAGVYGVMAYVVGERANEIGLRMALGASAGDVLRLVLGQALALTLAGLVIGIAASFAATRLLESLLFEVKRNDPFTYAAVAVTLAVVAMLASLIPALRAARVDPLIALRQE